MPATPPRTPAAPAPPLPTTAGVAGAGPPACTPPASRGVAPGTGLAPLLGGPLPLTPPPPLPPPPSAAKDGREKGRDVPATAACLDGGLAASSSSTWGFSHQRVPRSERRRHTSGVASPRAGGGSAAAAQGSAVCRILPAVMPPPSPSQARTASLYLHPSRVMMRSSAARRRSGTQSSWSGRDSAGLGEQRRSPWELYRRSLVQECFGGGIATA